MSQWHGRRGHVSEDTRRPPTDEEWSQSPEAMLIAGAERLAREDVLELVEAMIAELPTREAEVAALRWCDNPAPWAEVALRCGMSISAARTTEERARDRILEWLGYAHLGEGAPDWFLRRAA